jgi:hypothetical protein
MEQVGRMAAHGRYAQFHIMGSRRLKRTACHWQIQAATAHMTMLEQTPERVMGYFQDRHVKYAA